MDPTNKVLVNNDLWILNTFYHPLKGWAGGFYLTLILLIFNTMVKYSNAMVKCSWVCLFLFIVNNLQAQLYVADSAFANSDLNYAKHYYFTQRGGESAIYNGSQHDEYPSSIEGHAYFQSPGWQKGSVIYNNTLYENIIMKYDLLKDQLIVAPRDSGGIFIALFNPRIAQFSFTGFNFIRIDKTKENILLLPGFYQQLVQGKLTALAKRSKVIHSEIIAATFTQKFEEKVKYYLFRNNIYYPIKNKKSILTIIKDRRKEVQQFLSKNKLNYRKSPEKTIVAVAEFYNQSGY